MLVPQKAVANRPATFSHTMTIIRIRRRKTRVAATENIEDNVMCIASSRFGWTTKHTHIHPFQHFFFEKFA
ncbi:hypothetical protein [Burkholderia singularis]|uniref:hypothetical protein n=1 Tax=Burkholderia singularis TaxID=1503053 RepID=UPI00117E2900|nr:hypothetical protein [Burkholderia singularis]